MMDTNVPRVRVMISSTRADLAQYRDEAAKIIRRVATEKEKRVQFVEVSMEKEVQSGEGEYPVAVSKRWIDESDWVVLIVGWNYGSITDEPGANGLSVTEWEYRHAEERGKRIFAFLTGNLGTENQYRYSSEERNDLKDWALTQSSAQQQKLRGFREELGKRHVEMFANLQMFRERLEKTLREAIDDLRVDIPPGSPLADLITAVTPAIRDFIRKVTLIANCKQNHDCLHELLQQVIRRLQEEVLPIWRQEGTLRAAKERVVLGCTNRLSRQLGALSQLTHSTPPDHAELRSSIEKLLRQPPLWDIESESPPGVDEFGERLDSFTFLVQHAFREADRSMMGEERALHAFYEALLKHIGEARRQRQLSMSEEQQLNRRLDDVQGLTDRLSKELKTHHDWQSIHDAMERLDDLRGTPRFRSKLASFCETSVETLLHLIDQSALPQGSDRIGASAERAAAAASAGNDHESAPTEASDCEIYRENLARLSEQLAVLRRSKDPRDYDNIQRSFDAAFYCVDKKTLREVESARERVLAVEQFLDELVQAHKTAA